MQPFTQNLAQYLPDAAVLAAVFLLLLPRWRRQGRRRLAVSALFYLYMAGVLSMIGVHHPYQPMVLEPFRDLRLGYGNALRQLLLNALMTVPLGFLWPLVRRRSGLLRAVGAAFLLSLCIELVQPLLPTARTADITDLICNTAGGLAGYVLYLPWKRALRGWM